MTSLRCRLPKISIPLVTSVWAAREHGGSLVVEPFTLPGVGRGLLRHRPGQGPDRTHAYDPRA
jgi:hypothetical protein